jgi:hypothetical protein
MGDILSRPWVALGAVRGGCGELLGVEAGDGGACHCAGLRGQPVGTVLRGKSIARGGVWHVL